MDLSTNSCLNTQLSCLFRHLWWSIVWAEGLPVPDAPASYPSWWPFMGLSPASWGLLHREAPKLGTVQDVATGQSTRGQLFPFPGPPGFVLVEAAQGNSLCFWKCSPLTPRAVNVLRGGLSVVTANGHYHEFLNEIVFVVSTTVKAFTNKVSRGLWRRRSPCGFITWREWWVIWLLEKGGVYWCKAV